MRRVAQLLFVVSMAAAMATVTAPTFAANLRVDGKLISTAPTGAPLEVQSQTLVENLNADKLDGLDAADLVSQEYLAQTAAIAREAYFSSDSTFVVPAGVHQLEVKVIGGGGGGGGGRVGHGGNGGGGAGVIVATAILVTPGEALVVDVGEGGAGGAAGAESESFPGTDGEKSLLSSTDGWRVEAAGGGGGSGDTGGSGSFGGGGGGVLNELPQGGFGTFGSGDDSSGDGGAGASGGSGGGVLGGGGGGGPGGGNGGTGSIDETAPTAGSPGGQPGAGGGGGGASLLQSAAGGDGAAGLILIRWLGPPLEET